MFMRMRDMGVVFVWLVLLATGTVACSGEPTNDSVELKESAESFVLSNAEWRLDMSDGQSALLKAERATGNKDMTRWQLIGVVVGLGDNNIEATKAVWDVGADSIVLGGDCRVTFGDHVLDATSVSLALKESTWKASGNVRIKSTAMIAQGNEAGGLLSGDGRFWLKPAHVTAGLK